MRLRLWHVLCLLRSTAQKHPQLAVKLRFHNETRDSLDQLADEFANEHDLLNHGQVGELMGHYLFTANEHRPSHLLRSIRSHPSVEYYAPQVQLIRDKRAVIRAKPSIGYDITFTDPEYPKQWHLHNSRHAHADCNVTGVWANNITGKGVIVAVVDDGVQWNHPDLAMNYAPEGSFDLNANDDDPMPEYDSREENKHGTRCAGEIAAAPNDICGVGVSFGAKFSGIRVLDGPITDSMEAIAFNKHLDINDIYSCSWGPEDDAKTLDGPHPLAQAALIHGVTAGRHGFGSIYIVASGNGGAEGDNCNFDGYANSIYTITIGAVDERGDMPYYAEECASMLASTFSSGHPGGRETRKIVTTDWTLGSSQDQGGCTASHTGTSAATPLAAGMVALMLEVRPCLTWRDIQYIIALTARKITGTRSRRTAAWTVNGVGLTHSTQYGFGVLDAWRMVNAAKTWTPVPMLTTMAPPTIGADERIRADGVGLRVVATVTENDAQRHMLNSLENVQVTVTIEHGRRGDIEVTIVCPSGTESLVAPNRAKDVSTLGFKEWTFSTVRCWGESPVGTFALFIHDRGQHDDGVLKYWRLQLYGSSWSPEDVIKRREAVENSYSGEFINPQSNYTVECPEGTRSKDPFVETNRNMSDRSLKLMALMSGSGLI